MYNLILYLFLILAADEQLLSLKIDPPAATAKAGGQAEFRIKLVIPAGYHINSNRPGDEYLIPTAIKFEKAREFDEVAVSYPEGKKRRYSYTEAPISVYEGEVELVVTAQVSKRALTGRRALKGELVYQPCSEQYCLSPERLALSLPVTVIR